ncbi:hypothetical protein [Streptomyces sp. enrichment culture]|uniref:hypothetical protein n=1 Tax=Streptomyces sp. enrichment culture TaxID=1795815 RepID=UPI003F546B85
MPAAPTRFHDPGVTADAFHRSVLVRCPRCARVAHYAQGRGQRLVCRSCGLSRRSTGPDDGFARPELWLRTETRHGTLWAYNLEHLDLLRRFVAATLRERDPWYEHHRKMTCVGRLPAWIKRARNRDEVLRALDRLRMSVVTG